MYVCMYVCTAWSSCAYPHTHTHTNAYEHARCIYTHAYMHMCTHRTYLHTHTGIKKKTS
jgi:hypothetical protein